MGEVVGIEIEAAHTTGNQQVLVFRMIENDKQQRPGTTGYQQAAS
jgi:hypothetical protein